jgi:outer membrane lipoprotein-sorting protein
MKSIPWSKLKCLAALSLTAVVVSPAGMVAGSQINFGDKLSPQDIAAKSRAAYAALSSYSDDGAVTSEMGAQTNTTTFTTRLQRPGLYRVEWTQGARSKGAVWSDGNGDYLQTTTAGQDSSGKSNKMENMKKALTQAAGISWSAASTTPGAFFDQDFGDVFVAPVASGRHPLTLESDARLGKVECYVVSSVLDFSKIPDNKGKPGTASTMLWIGKEDFLIHQCRTKYVEKVDTSAPPTDQAIDDATKKALEMQHKPVTPEAVAAMRPQMKAIMKQVQTTLKSSFEAGVVTTQTHENISVNRKFSPADFVH